tara:strand:+ start:229 stop:501 length:273 start_codon:yes stop_codon:yes gene_type:complete
MKMKAPEGYSYLTEDFNTKYKRIMLIHHRDYVYAEGKEVKTVWGFINKKTGQVHSPINAKKPGKVVDKSKVRSYTSMPLKEVSQAILPGV